MSNDGEKHDKKNGSKPNSSTDKGRSEEVQSIKNIVRGKKEATPLGFWKKNRSTFLGANPEAVVDKMRGKCGYNYALGMFDSLFNDQI